MKIGDDVLTTRRVGNIPAGSQGIIDNIQDGKIKVTIKYFPNSDCDEVTFPLPYRDASDFKPGQICLKSR